MEPVVSVIMPCHNGARYLSEAVESLLSQTFENWECIIIDDGSTDDTRQVSQALVQRDQRVQYLYQEQAGAYIARNFGLEHARGEWIQFLDADDWLHRDKIRYQLSHVPALPADQRVVLYCDYELVYQDGDGNTTKKVTNIIGDLSNEQLLERVATWDRSPDFPFIIHSVLFHRDLFKTRQFDELLKHFGDIEFEIDLLVKGVPFVYTPLIGAFYRRHTGQQMTKAADHTKYYVDLLELLYEKDKSLTYRNPEIARLTHKALKRREKQDFNRLSRMINLKQTPVEFARGRIQIKHKSLLKLAFLLRSVLPFRLY